MEGQPYIYGSLLCLRTRPHSSQFYQTLLAPNFCLRGHFLENIITNRPSYTIAVIKSPKRTFGERCSVALKWRQQLQNITILMFQFNQPVNVRLQMTIQEQQTITKKRQLSHSCFVFAT